MHTLRVHPVKESQEKVPKAVFEALNIEYEEEGSELDETGRILANSYLANKLVQSRQDLLEGKGEKIPMKDLWK